MRPPRGSISTVAQAAGKSLDRIMASSSWLGCGSLGDLLVDRRLRLLLLLLQAPRLDDDARNLVQWARQRRLDRMGRVAEALGGGDQRPERTLDRHIEVERDAVDRPNQPLRAGVTQPNPLDREPRREFAVEIAVEPDDHRVEFEVAQSIEGEAAHHPKV